MSTCTNDKKREILNASIYLFSNKGYSATLVQDIATYCNISKATIYKLFKSKEEILSEIIRYFNTELLKVKAEIDADLSLSSKERFIKKIAVILTSFAERKDFTLTIIQYEGSFKDSVVEEAFSESKLLILNWLKESCYEYFGDKVENIIWDLTYTLRGLVKEFSYIFIMKRVLEKDFYEVATFIVNSIIYITDKHIKDEPLIPADSIKFLCSNKNFQFNKELLISEWENEIKEIRHTISNSFSLVNNTELDESLNLLIEEFKKDDRKEFLIDALLLYLNNFAELSTHVMYLKKIWIKIK